MASETCPHCGAAADNVRCPGNDNWYACGTMESDPKDRGGKCYRNEIANLRSKNRDLQQAYDHVLECEQNRCREVVELQGRLEEVASERDEERENSRILRSSRDEETAIADSWMRKCNELEQQLDKMKKQKELDDYHILKLQGILEGSTKRNRHKRETIKTLQDQLAEVTAERDDFRDTAAAIMTAACGTDDVDEQERLCNRAGTKPSQFVAALKSERDGLRRRIDEAPVAFASVYEDGSFCHIEKWIPDDNQEVLIKTVRYRLVPDPETQNA